MLSRKFKGLLVLAALIGASQATQAQTVTAAMAAPAGSINTNKPGFKVRVFKGNSRINPNALAPAELIISGLAIDSA